MSVVVYANGPTVTAPPPLRPLTRLQVLWTGPDGGTTWDLTNPAGGVYITDDGVEGLHLPEFEDYVSEAAGIDGQRFRGGRTKARKVELSLLLWRDSSPEWLALEQSWWRSLHPRRAGTLTIRAGSRTRRLRCRLASDGGYVHVQDPSAAGWAAYPLSLVADQPHYLGDPITGGWGRQPDDVRPLIPEGGGPPLHISNGRTYDSATYANPGDEDTWATWTAYGPIDRAVITVDGGAIGLPAVPEGSQLVVYTDPLNGTAWLDGQDVSGLIDPWDPAPLPPGVAVPIGLDVQGAGRIELWAETRYWRFT